MLASCIGLSRRTPLSLLMVLIICLLTESFQCSGGRSTSAIDRPRGSNSRIIHKSSKSLKLNARDRTEVDFFSFKDIEDYAKISGLTLNCTTTGPFLRIEAFPIGEVELIGYLTAFIRPLPFGLFHLDTIKVKNRRQNLGYQRKNWTIDGPGISFIMGSYALLWAYERGCRKSQLLAVNDEALMHAILTRLYQSFGFRTLREVTEDTTSTGDRLVWGAIGTLMELDIKSFFTEWTPKLTELSESAIASRLRNIETTQKAQ